MSQESKQNWANIEEVGVFWLMKFSLLLRTLLGSTAFKLILIPIISYYFISNTAARQASYSYLSHLKKFAPNTPIKPTAWFSYLHFLAFGQSIVDKLSAWSGKINIDQVVIHGREDFLNNANEQQGALIIGAHLGNPELSRALGSIHRDIKINVLVHTKHAKQFNRLLNSVSQKNRMELIQVSELSPAMAISLDEKIRHGEFVFIVGDRVPVNNQSRTLSASFLGEDAAFAQGPFILAALLKCPVYSLFCIQQQKKYHIYFEHFAHQIILPRKNRELALQTYIQMFAQRLEKYCLLAPLQWFNFYNYWANHQHKS